MGRKKNDIPGELDKIRTTWSGASGEIMVDIRGRSIPPGDLCAVLRR